MLRRSLVSVSLLSVGFLLVTGCGGRLRRELAGGATVTDPQVIDTKAEAPRRIYVADFDADPSVFKAPSGVVSEVLDNRPRLLEGGAGGGIVGQRLGSDAPVPAQVVDQLASSITHGLNEQKLGYPAERLAPGAPVPDSGWLVQGRIVAVDPGNRAERAVVGFGTGEATASVEVEVDRLSPGGETPVMRFGAKSDSGKAPGAVVTMNPYVAAAKFVIGKGATSRDIQAMGGEIAKQIGDYARSRGVAK
jgi:hypothetical protein